jgi:hypothetical protein
MGREWVSAKHGDAKRLWFRGGRVTGRHLDMADPKQMKWWALNKVTPISFNKLTRAYREDEDISEQIIPSISGMLGFPAYHRPEK